MIYCDTSLLVSALTIEPRTQDVQAWLVGRNSGELCTSAWTTAEFSSAIALKLRRGAITPDDRDRAVANWRTVQTNKLNMIPVPAEAFDLAARFCGMSASTLRAGDALHLAIASLGSHALATLDETMREGALAVGVRVVGVMI